MPHQVFLSYSTKDTAATEAVCGFLEGKGVRCWMAPRDIPVGHDWAEAIIGALNRCPVMVLIYSSNANASMQVTREVQRAFEKGLAVFPFRIEAVQPNPGLEYYLGSVHWLDALTPPLEAHMGKLAAEVQKALRRHEEGAPAADFPTAPARRQAASKAPAPGSKKGVLAAAVLAGCAALGGTAWWIASQDRNRQEEPPPPSQLSASSAPASATPPTDAAAQPTPPHDELEATGDAPPEKAPASEPPAALAEATPAAAPTPEEPPPPPAAATPAEATRELPWRDGLGLAYLPVPGTEVLFAQWPVQVRDYERFAEASNREWPEAGFEQGPDHPAVNITWNDAQAFCDWLTEEEAKAERLPPGYHYRLPTDAEWDRALGLDGTVPPEEAAKHHPWGAQWPPPRDAGNYAASLETDAFSHTSPVGSFAPNRFGLFDMGGNVWQWCAEKPGLEYRTARGGSWKSSTADARSQVAPVYRNSGYGFRCVLAPAP